MHSIYSVSAFALLPVVLISPTVFASEESNGPNGINSIVTGLNGMGIAIGQVEPGRPGKDDVDNDPSCCNDDVETD